MAGFAAGTVGLVQMVKRLERRMVLIVMDDQSWAERDMVMGVF